MIQRQYQRREDAPGRAAVVVTKWTFDPSLTIIRSRDRLIDMDDAALVARGNSPSGVSQSEVDAALESEARALNRCFNDAWQQDLSLESRVRMESMVAGGQVSAVDFLREEDTNEPLADCYAQTVHAMTFPESTTGTVRWEFIVHRSNVYDSEVQRPLRLGPGGIVAVVGGVLVASLVARGVVLAQGLDLL